LGDCKKAAFEVKNRETFRAFGRLKDMISTPGGLAGCDMM